MDRSNAMAEDDYKELWKDHMKELEKKNEKEEWEGKFTEKSKKQLESYDLVNKDLTLMKDNIFGPYEVKWKQMGSKSTVLTNVTFGDTAERYWSATYLDHLKRPISVFFAHERFQKWDIPEKLNTGGFFWEGNHPQVTKGKDKGKEPKKKDPCVLYFGYAGFRANFDNIFFVVHPTNWRPFQKRFKSVLRMSLKCLKMEVDTSWSQIKGDVQDGIYDGPEKLTKKLLESHSKFWSKKGLTKLNEEVEFFTTQWKLKKEANAKFIECMKEVNTEAVSDYLAVDGKSIEAGLAEVGELALAPFGWATDAAAPFVGSIVKNLADRHLGDKLRYIGPGPKRKYEAGGDPVISFKASDEDLTEDYHRDDIKSNSKKRKIAWPDEGKSDVKYDSKTKVEPFTAP